MHAISSTTEKAKDFGILRTHIFTNAKKVKAIKGAKDWAIKNLVEEILDVSWFFKKTEFSIIRRDLNGAAHSLAKFGFERGENMILSGRVGSFLEWMKVFEVLLQGF